MVETFEEMQERINKESEAMGLITNKKVNSDDSIKEPEEIIEEEPEEIIEEEPEEEPNINNNKYDETVNNNKYDHNILKKKLDMRFDDYESSSTSSGFDAMSLVVGMIGLGVVVMVGFHVFKSIKPILDGAIMGSSGLNSGATGTSSFSIMFIIMLIPIVFIMFSFMTNIFRRFDI